MLLPIYLDFWSIQKLNKSLIFLVFKTNNEKQKNDSRTCLDFETKKLPCKKQQHQKTTKELKANQRKHNF